VLHGDLCRASREKGLSGDRVPTDNGPLVIPPVHRCRDKPPTTPHGVGRLTSFHDLSTFSALSAGTSGYWWDGP
jgi:hypothetical protein